MIQFIKTEEVKSLSAYNPVFILIDEKKQPVLMVSEVQNKSLRLSDISQSIFGDQPVNVALLDIPIETVMLKQCIDAILSFQLNQETHASKEDESQKIQGVFTKREIEILRLIAMEFTNEEIADKLCLAKRTVDNHRVKLMHRVNVKNTAGLIGYAYRNGLIE